MGKMTHRHLVVNLSKIIKKHIFKTEKLFFATDAVLWSLDALL